MGQAYDEALSDEINMISLPSKDEVPDLRKGPTEIMDTSVEDPVYEDLDVSVAEEPFEEEVNHADTSKLFIRYWPQLLTVSHRKENDGDS